MRVTNKVRGFTLVELIVVIAVVGILATVTVIGFGKFQTNTRDAQRSSSANVIVEALEKYYDQNGEYPSCSQLTGDFSTVTSTLKGISKSVLVAPQASSGVTNSIKCTSNGDVLAVNGPDFFEYQGDGSTDCSTGTSCIEYKLRYKNESNGQIQTITSRRTTLLATSGTLALDSNYIGFTSVSLNWSHIQNSTLYTYQRSTSTDFSANLSEGTTTAETLDVNGLTKNTQYYFRVRATSQNGQVTAWSNVVGVKTLDLTSPSITSIATSNTVLTPTWTSVANATVYRLQYSTSSGFTASTTTTIDNISATSQAVSGLDQGRLLYFRVYPISGTVVGTASSVVSANTTIATPTKPVMATPTNSFKDPYYTTVWNWTPGSTCAANTSMYYQTMYAYNAATPYSSSWSSANASTTYSLYTYEGYKYTVSVQARCRSNSTSTIVSSWSGSSSASYSQSVTNATSISWRAERGDANTIVMYSQASCRIGASPYGSIDPYARELQWTSGPNTGNSGWRTPGGYSFTGLWLPSVSVYNTKGAIQNGWMFTSRALIYCRNYDTGVQSPSGVSSQPGGWTWGSNI